MKVLEKVGLWVALFTTACGAQKETTGLPAGIYGKWQFERLETASDSEPIKKAWSGSSLDFHEDEILVTHNMGTSVWSIDPSSDSTTLNLKTKYANRVIYLYKLKDDILRLSFLPHGIPKSFEKGIVVRFKRQVSPSKNAMQK